MSEKVWGVDATSLENDYSIAALDIGTTVNSKWKTLAAGGTSKEYTEHDTTVTSIQRADTLSQIISTGTEGTDYAIISSTNSTIPIYAWYDNGTIYYYSEATVIGLNPISSALFQDFQNLTGIGDFETEDTSQVTNMQDMFYYTGNNAATFNLDLADWDTSSLENAEGMFFAAGAGATNWNIKGLSIWDTSSLTNTIGMFYGAGSNAPTFSLNLSTWDTSKITSMEKMFQSAGQNSTTFDLNLSSWDTSSVQDMANMFNYTGYRATTWSIGDLSSCDVSSVTDMSSMFFGAGYNAAVWDIGNLSDWDTSNVVNMNRMFYNAGRNATTWQSIGTLKVYATNIANMFYNCPKATAVLNIYSNPESGYSGYNSAFYNAATASGALITVNYANTTTNIDSIIATKSSTSNVVKGSVLS